MRASSLCVCWQEQKDLFVAGCQLLITYTSLCNSMCACFPACDACLPAVPASKRRRVSAAAAAAVGQEAHDKEQQQTSSGRRKPASSRAVKTGRSAARGAGAAGAAADVASAGAAAAEKAAAGENRAVEHVALQADEWTDQLMFGGGPPAVAPVATPVPSRATRRTRGR